MSQSGLVSVTTAAAMLGVSKRTVLRWIAANELTAQRIGPATSAWVIDLASVEALIDRRREQLAADLAALESA